MSNKTDTMGEQFKSIAEMKAYTDAQYKTIITLNQKINELEEKNRSLEEILANSVPMVKEQAAEIQLLSQGSDEETICRLQLKLLKDRVLAGEELTMEDTKKADIYARLILAIKQGDKKQSEKLAEKLDDSQLLDFLKDMNPNTMK